VFINQIARKRVIMATALTMSMFTPFIFAPLQRLVEQHECPLGTPVEHVTPVAPDFVTIVPTVPD
jgi:hypothetical protein